jgi:hypothetical protein
MPADLRLLDPPEGNFSGLIAGRETDPTRPHQEYAVPGEEPQARAGESAAGRSRLGNGLPAQSVGGNARWNKCSELRSKVLIEEWRRHFNEVRIRASAISRRTSSWLEEQGQRPAMQRAGTLRYMGPPRPGPLLNRPRGDKCSEQGGGRLKLTVFRRTWAGHPMVRRIPASQDTREGLTALIEGRLSTASAKNELVKLATRLIVEEALEGEGTMDPEDFHRELDPTPGIREQPGPGVIRGAATVCLRSNRAVTVASQPNHLNNVSVYTTASI